MSRVPAIDSAIVRTYGPDDFAGAKAENKMALQHRLGLEVNAAAPVFFWPSRLDPAQKGPQLLTDILHRTVSDYHDSGLQVVVVADGPTREILADSALLSRHRLELPYGFRLD